MSKSSAPWLWVKIVMPGRGVVGPGKITLLRAVRETGSISAAARSIDLSYKKAWELLDELNGMFRTPVVETRIGGSERGGAQVTPLGERLIEAYAEAAESANTANARVLQELSRA